MKFTKISLIALLAISGAYATEGTISGDVKVFYGTDDIGDNDMFDKGASYGDASMSLDYSRNIKDNITINAGVTGLSTLGLENTLVSNVWAGGEGDDGLEDSFWIDTANVTAKFGKTTAIIGRQKLDTPLAFTETWNIVENTFDAFTFLNSDIENTTLVASAVTRANGMGNFTNFQGGMTDLGDGIYTAGAITKAIPNTTAQLWYYGANGVVDNQKVWAQADTKLDKGFSLGLQYAKGSSDSQLVAGKIGYDVDNISAYVAYSDADDKGKYNFANYGGFGGSKAYTEAWWNFGFVTEPDASTVATGIAYDMGNAKVGVQYTSVDSGDNGNGDMAELTLTADTNIKGIDTSFAYINTDADDKGIDGNTVQVYLTLPFSL